MPSRDHSPAGDSGRNEASELDMTSSTSAQNYRYQTSSSNQIDTSSSANFTTFERFSNDEEQGNDGDTVFVDSIWKMNAGGQPNPSSSYQNYHSSSSTNKQGLQDNDKSGETGTGATGGTSSSATITGSNSDNRNVSYSAASRAGQGDEENETSNEDTLERTHRGLSSNSTGAEQYKANSSGDAGTVMSTGNAAQSNDDGVSTIQGSSTHNEPGATTGSADSTVITDRNTDNTRSRKEDTEPSERISNQDDAQRDSFEEASERTPLLPRDSDNDEDIEDDESSKKKRTRWPSFVALGLLCIAVILAIVFGFAAPAAVEEYAKEAITFEPGNMSVESFTSQGLEARAQGVFYLDGAKVQKQTVRNIGRFATWIAKEIEIDQGEVNVFLADYNNSLLGTARIPTLNINIQNGHHNYLDIVSNVQPGDLSQIRTLALDVMDGKQTLNVHAIVSANVKSGILTLGRKTFTTSMTLHRSGNTTLPTIHISNMTVGEYGSPGHSQGIKAQASISTFNKYPVRFNVPPLAFNILLKDCSSKPLSLGSMNTELIHVAPESFINTTVVGFMHKIPTNLTQTCPNSERSPLDEFIGAYLAGKEAQIYVSGGKQDLKRTPGWIGDILSDLVVPVPVPAHGGFNHMIKNFSLSDVHFNLPQLGADPYPRLSAIVNVVVGIPKHINIDVSVDRVRADAEMYYKGKKLGVLDLQEWQESNSSMTEGELHVQSIVKDAPLKVTDQDVFTEVLSAMIFGGGGLAMEVRAKVDVRTTTVLGQFVVRKLPSNGTIVIKPVSGKIQQTIKDISVVGSSPEELIMRTKVEVKNPSDYSAKIPYFNISIWCNETRLGYMWGALDVHPGMNTLVVDASYSAGPVGAELLSQYISGRNTSITIKTHNGSIPGLPDPRLSVDVPMPHMFGKLTKEATMHLFSSTVTFILFSPLQMLITDIDAHAYFNGTEIGEIKYNEPIVIKVGDNETPALPVSWNFNGGLKLIKEALGGTLKLDTHADMGVRIGEWQAQLWYEGKGVGAKVKLFSDLDEE